MKLLIVSLLIILVVLHQDSWWWNSDTLLFGFLPVGLAWHAGISLAAGVVWYLATRFCWPTALEVEEPPEGTGSPPRAAESERGGA